MALALLTKSRPLRPQPVAAYLSAGEAAPPHLAQRTILPVREAHFSDMRQDLQLRQARSDGAPRVVQDPMRNRLAAARHHQGLRYVAIRAEKREALERWAARLLAIAGDNVIPLPKRQAN
jgi:hypothetical protein